MITTNPAQVNADLAMLTSGGVAGGAEPASTGRRRAAGEGASILVQSARSVASKAVEHALTVASIGVLAGLAWLGRHLF